MKTTLTLALILLFGLTVKVSFGQKPVEASEYINVDSAYAAEQVEIAHRANVYNYKHVIKFSSGISTENFYVEQVLRDHRNPETESFIFPRVRPSLSFSHEIYLDEIMSLAYTIGYTRNNIKLNGANLQNQQAFVFIKPKLNFFRRKNIEGYMQLNVGLVYNDMNFDMIQNDQMRRLLPGNFKMYTGFTPIGLNFRLTDQLWANFEGSLWSFEALSVGLKYKLKKNWEHPKYWAY
ncbi:MAG: hypothetical protein HUJ25_12845 [Crocinitomicaceae bacterium]|nr:hypothetical protein [Crocinitomicaceae bacterium]